MFAFSRSASNTTIILINNTVSANAADTGGGLGLYADTGALSNVTVTNSIIWGNSAIAGGHDIAIESDLGGAAMVDASFSDIGDVLEDGGTYNNLGSNIDSDPLFINLSGGDLHLGVGSPTIDAGTASGAPDDDFEGQARPQGLGPDMGADEFIPIPLSVLAPKAGDTWGIGTQHTITWLPTTGKVQIQISRNGSPWRVLVKQTGNDGSQVWRVKRPAAQARIRVCTVVRRGPSTCGPSSPSFTIQ